MGVGLLGGLFDDMLCCGLFVVVRVVFVFDFVDYF